MSGAHTEHEALMAKLKDLESHLTELAKVAGSLDVLFIDLADRVTALGVDIKRLRAPCRPDAYAAPAPSVDVGACAVPPPPSECPW